MNATQLSKPKFDPSGIDFDINETASQCDLTHIIITAEQEEPSLSFYRPVGIASSMGEVVDLAMGHYISLNRDVDDCVYQYVLHARDGRGVYQWIGTLKP